ncbi:MAG: F0F1 ATP synthase subunit epsilon [bacterium]|nr:F0F1 ATP synthase subunit epsilon [bacterium]
MAEKIKIEIVTPDALVLSAEVDEVTASGTEGEFGVLPGHYHMLSSLKVGAVNYKDGAVVRHIALGGGYAEVGPEKVTILAETAEFAEDIDVDRANKALAAAEELLKTLSMEEAGYEECLLSIEKAQTRIEIAAKQ